MKNERGITLIAVVVTIAILVIILAVTLNTGLIENNSVIREVTKETDKQQEQVKNEQEKMNDVISSYEEEWGLS